MGRAANRARYVAMCEAATRLYGYNPMGPPLCLAAGGWLRRELAVFHSALESFTPRDVYGVIRENITLPRVAANEAVPATSATPWRDPELQAEQAATFRHLAAIPTQSAAVHPARKARRIDV